MSRLNNLSRDGVKVTYLGLALWIAHFVSLQQPGLFSLTGLDRLEERHLEGDFIFVCQLFEMAVQTIELVGRGEVVPAKFLDVLLSHPREVFVQLIVIIRALSVP
jgi:hypothetical protein